MNRLGVCLRCDRQIIEIDHYGQRLIGCVDCNRWSWEGSKRLLHGAALRAMRIRMAKPMPYTIQPSSLALSLASLQA
jgi:hypothetical protein